ncbi:hypothetical protein lerEdw1_009965 [Lerista edwardsae]|nr:hypothetical protein lerEdw1_009965 [Lerista edwardsae]
MRRSPILGLSVSLQVPSNVRLLNRCKNTFCVISCFNFMVILSITISPFWLVRRFVGGDYVTGMWFSCYQSRCGFIFVRTVYLDIVRILLIAAVMNSLIPMVSARDRLPRYIKQKIPEGLFASVAEFITGICLLCSLVIVSTQLTFDTDEEGHHLQLYRDFFIGCIICSLCFILDFIHHNCLLRPIELPRPFLEQLLSYLEELVISIPTLESLFISWTIAGSFLA